MDNDLTLEFLDEPVNEYFVSHIKTEMVEGILVRLYCCKMIGNKLQLQYTVLLPVKRMAEIGRQCLQAVTEVDPTKMWEGNILIH